MIYQIIDYVSANPPEQKRSPEKAEAQPAIKKENKPQRKEHPRKDPEQRKTIQRRTKTKNHKKNQKILTQEIKSVLTTNPNTRTKIITRTITNTHAIRSKR